MAWETLLNIARTNHEYAEQEQAESDNPTRCPHDGLALVEVNGVRDCPFGDFRWPPHAVQ